MQTLEINTASATSVCESLHMPPAGLTSSSCKQIVRGNSLELFPAVCLGISVPVTSACDCKHQRGLVQKVTLASLHIGWHHAKVIMVQLSSTIISSTVIELSLCHSAVCLVSYKKTEARESFSNMPLVLPT